MLTKNARFCFCMIFCTSILYKFNILRRFFKCSRIFLVFKAIFQTVFYSYLVKNAKLATLQLKHSCRDIYFGILSHERYPIVLSRGAAFMCHHNYHTHSQRMWAGGIAKSTLNPCDHYTTQMRFSLYASACASPHIPNMNVKPRNLVRRTEDHYGVVCYSDSTGRVRFATKPLLSTSLIWLGQLFVEKCTVQTYADVTKRKERGSFF